MKLFNFITIIFILIFLNSCDYNNHEFVKSFPIKKEYYLPLNKKDIFLLMDEAHGFSANLNTNLLDSAFIIYFQIPTKKAAYFNIEALVRIKEIDSKMSKIIFDSVIGTGGASSDEEGYKEIEKFNSISSTEKYIELFQKHFLTQILINKQKTSNRENVVRICFDNARLYFLYFNHDHIFKEDSLKP
jgi:hypothetical protein